MVGFGFVKIQRVLISVAPLYFLLWATCSVVAADEQADRGYRHLTETAFLSGDFDQGVFDQTWRVWPKPLRDRAQAATLLERRQMAFDRYGLTPRPGDDSGKPLQYVVSESGKWTMNCFSCHGGSVYGTPTPGAPNNRFALQAFVEEIRKTKFLVGAPLTRMDFGSVVIPLGGTNGTTNAVVFGMGLMSYRDTDLNVVDLTPRIFVNHDMDAPPWWHFHKRPYLYIDGFAQRGHRGLMQFMLVPENGPDFFVNHEAEFKDVYAYLMSLRPPKFTEPIDGGLAEKGEVVFNQHCAECHGTRNGEYPNRRIPLLEIGTDPVRLTALSTEGRRKYGQTWFAHAGELGEQITIEDPDGYVAPPLDGVWASAPYFHNGSVPTLWHVLNPDERPTIWRRTNIAMDSERIGLQIEELDSVPRIDADPVKQRSYFDTRKFGKSNQGHDYPSQLTNSERRAVLEYLKTL